MAVTLPDAVFSQYARFSLYNSPYPAHDAGRAIDLYPGTFADGRTTAAPSPVAGTVRETRAVRAPSKPYAPEHDHLLLIDCDESSPFTGLVARVLHVEPTVEAGDRIERGDSLGDLVRAGFFAPWVDNHLHLEFRRPEQNLRRASGSLALELGVDPRPLAWDGTGTVVATGETYAVLDAPAHPNPGAEFVGVRARPGGVLDGGLPHYDGGGFHADADSHHQFEREHRVSLAGDEVGVLGDDGRTIAWEDVVVTANGEPITGLSTFCARDDGFGAKLICPDHALAVGDDVRVRIRPGDEV
ncbi:hypothetical protein ACLI4Z_03885 [Natrialbaceae archaeon A-arb3/5]